MKIILTIGVLILLMIEAWLVPHNLLALLVYWAVTIATSYYFLRQRD